MPANLKQARCLRSQYITNFFAASTEKLVRCKAATGYNYSCRLQTSPLNCLKNECRFPYYFRSMYSTTLSVRKATAALRILSLCFGIALLLTNAPSLLAQENGKGGAPALKVTKTSYNFGEIYVGEEIAYTFFLHNTGAAPLTVSETPVYSNAVGNVVGQTLSPIEKMKYVAIQSATSPTPLGCACQMQDFYYDKVIQPGQIGVVRIAMRGTEKLGATEAAYKLYTNDPRQYAIDLKLTGTVKAVPDFIKRIANANITNGEQVGSYRVYPTAKPDVTIERNEPYQLTVKIKATGVEDGELKIAAPVEGATVNLKKNAATEQYTLDIVPNPVGAGGTRTIKIRLQSTGAKGETFDVVVTLHTPDNSLIYTPENVNGGEVALASFKNAALRVGRVSLRKTVGKFKILSVTSSLPFLQPEVQTLVDGSNYMVRLNTLPTAAPKAGAYEGMIRVETDEPGYTKIEIPVKIVVTAK